MKQVSKVITYFVLIVTVLSSTCTLVSAASSTTGIPSSNKLTLNGKTQAFPAVNIDDRNWLKLRDMAMLLNGTKKQFSLDYDASTNTVVITSGETYTAAGGELTEFLTGDIGATATSQGFVFNGKKVSLSTYNINGGNYLQLRDLAKLLDLNIIWDGQTGIVTLDLDNSYSEDVASNPSALTKPAEDPAGSYVVKTYDELVKEMYIPDSDKTRRNIIIRGDIDIPKDISFRQCDVTIDEGYTVTTSSNICIGYNGSWAATLTIKGTLIVNNGGDFGATNSGIINVTGKGKVTLEKGIIFHWDNDGKINGLQNMPAVKGYYLWTGEKFDKVGASKDLATSVYTGMEMKTKELKGATYIVTTADEFMKLLDGNLCSKNIIFRGNMSIFSTIFFKDCTITVDEGYTVNFKGHYTLGNNATIDVKGNMALMGYLGVGKAGVVNVIGKGNIMAGNGAKLDWTAGEINAKPLQGAATKTGSYSWDGSKFVSKTTPTPEPENKSSGAAVVAPNK